MKNNGFLRLILLLIPVINFLSCSDHLPPETPSVKQRIKSITRTLPNDGSISNITTFSYSQNGNLSNLKSYQTPDSNVAIRGHSVVQITDGKLKEISRKLTNLSEEHYIFTYDPSGKPTTLDYDAGNSDVYKMIFQYSGNKLQSSSRKFTFTPIVYDQFLTYTFTGENLSSVNSTTVLSKNLTSTTTSASVFTYDNNINPFFGSVIIPAPDAISRPTQGNFNYYTYFGGFNNFLHLSKNNVTSEITSNNEETTYTYTYNSEGRPLSRIKMQKYPPLNNNVLVETLKFEYESY